MSIDINIELQSLKKSIQDAYSIIDGNDVIEYNSGYYYKDDNKKNTLLAVLIYNLHTMFTYHLSCRNKDDDDYYSFVMEDMVGNIHTETCGKITYMTMSPYLTTFNLTYYRGPDNERQAWFHAVTSETKYNFGYSDFIFRGQAHVLDRIVSRTNPFETDIRRFIEMKKFFFYSKKMFKQIHKVLYKFSKMDTDTNNTNPMSEKIKYEYLMRFMIKYFNFNINLNINTANNPYKKPLNVIVKYTSKNLTKQEKRINNINKIARSEY